MAYSDHKQMKEKRDFLPKFKLEQERSEYDLELDIPNCQSQPAELNYINANNLQKKEGSSTTKEISPPDDQKGQREGTQVTDFKDHFKD